MDIDKIGRNAIGTEDDEGYDKPVGVGCSPSCQNEVADNCHQADHQDVSCISVQPHARLIAPEPLGVVAKGFTLPSRIAIWNASQINIGIGISANKLEDVVAAAARLVDVGAIATGPSFITLSYIAGTRNMSEMESNRMKKALIKDPPATLPQFLHTNLEKELQQWDL